MNAEEYFFRKFGNKITASDSWVIRFAEEYASQSTPSPKEIDKEEVQKIAYELLESEATTGVTTEGEKQMFVQGCLQMATVLKSLPKEISEEEIEDNAIKRFRFHKDITPSEKTSLKIGFSVGAKWAINRLSLPSSGSKTEARNKIKDFLLWAWENGWTHEAKETWYKDIPEDKVDEESGLYYTKTHEQLFELFLKDKQQ